MNKTTYQILIGSLLGDGCIAKNNSKCKNYSFKEMHCVEQSEYVEWKAKMLSCFGAIYCGKRPELFTKTKKLFTRLRKEMYDDKNHKHIFEI